MRCRLTILALLVLAAAAVVVICPPVGGGADPGIKHEHLDSTPGDFVDDVTIEIDDTNGLQVKAIPADSVLPSKVDSIFGSWTEKDSQNNELAVDNVYKATSDGFVVMYAWSGHEGGWIKGYTDGLNPPVTQRVWNGSGYIDNGASFNMPVRKDDYWKATKYSTVGSNEYYIYWLPIGSGSCVKQ